jgi:hypothetical protein
MRALYLLIAPSLGHFWNDLHWVLMKQQNQALVIISTKEPSKCMDEVILSAFTIGIPLAILRTLWYFKFLRKSLRI